MKVCHDSFLWEHFEHSWVWAIIFSKCQATWNANRWLVEHTQSQINLILPKCYEWKSIVVIWYMVRDKRLRNFTAMSCIFISIFVGCAKLHGSEKCVEAAEMSFILFKAYLIVAEPKFHMNIFTLAATIFSTLFYWLSQRSGLLCFWIDFELASINFSIAIVITIIKNSYKLTKWKVYISFLLMLLKFRCISQNHSNAKHKERAFFKLS